MKKLRSKQAFTVIELLCGIAIITVLSVIYFFLVDSYKDRRMSEKAAQVLMLAAKAEEEFFAKDHHYFDAEISGNGGDVYLSTPGGGKTSVYIPPKVFLVLKTKGSERKEFVGYTFSTGSDKMHRYDSRTAKMSTVQRTQEEKYD